MSGDVAARVVMIGDGGVTAIVPVERIVADDVLPKGTALQAILIRSISLTDRNIASPGALQHVRERVQIEGHAATSPERRALMLAIRRALFANRFPTVTGLSRVTIEPMVAGPNLISEASVRVGIQDVMITYSEERSA